MTKLSVLVPTTPDRNGFVVRLGDQFREQLGQYVVVDRDNEPIGVYREIYKNGEVEILYLSTPRQADDNRIENSIGFKRNMLLDLADGEYIAFIDSDDRIGPNYFQRVMQGIELGVDCCSLRGIITENGLNPLVFEHSIKYNEYKTNPEGMPVRYERFPNHLNSIKSSIAKQFKFPEINHGEDTDWATQIHKSGLIKTEYYIDEVIYHYDWRKK